MRVATYLIYIVFWELLVIGGTGYAVFVLDASGWWFVLAVILSGSAYGPERWMNNPQLHKDMQDAE